MRAAAVAIVLGVLGCVAGSAGELIPNGGMEPPFGDGMPAGWQKNCWGKNTAAFSPGEPNQGKSSLKVDCTAFETGAVQFLYPLKVVGGRHYRVSLWMRAQGGVGSVGVGLRERPEPYTMHLSAEFEPGEEWEQFTFEGTSARSDERAGLFIWFAPDGPGTLWVDDVSVIEGEPKVPDMPVPTGNVVPNASFELALERDWRSRHDHPVADESKPFHGSRSLRWDLDGQADQLVSRLIELGGRGKPFALELAARAEGSATIEASVWPAVMLGASGPLLRLGAVPKSDWSVFRSAGPLPSDRNGAYFLSIDVRPKGKARVWLDAVRLAPADGSEAFRCAKPIEASLACPRLAHVHREGEAVRLEGCAYNDTGEARTLELACRVTDYWRRPVADVPVRLAMGPHSGGSTLISLPLQGTGVYLAELAQGSETLGELSFSVLPPVNAVPADRSVVGGHFRLDDFHLRVANAMGIKWTRIHDCETITHWATVEPEKGRSEWFDEKVRLAQQHDVRVLGEFLRVPKWASSAGPDVRGHDVHQCPPRDLAEFGSYVRGVVGHYRGYIRHWEIWNEPYGTGFWRGTPEQYAELAKVAARETRAADPRALLLAPCAYPNTHEWVERALAAGATSLADIFSYHGYDVYQPDAYRRVQTWAAHGRQKPLPIWNTETGPTSRTFYRHVPDKLADSYSNWLRPVPYGRAAEDAVKLFVLALAGGAERYFQYWCVYEESLLPRLSAMTIFEYDAALRPMAVAYAVAGSLLDGMRGQGWADLPVPARASLLRDDHRLVAVLWRTTGRRPSQLALPYRAAKLAARSLMGNPVKLKARGAGCEVPLGPEPLYLIVPSEDAESLLDALKHSARVAP